MQEKPLKHLMGAFKKNKFEKFSRGPKIMMSTGLELSPKHKKIIMKFCKFVYEMLELTEDYSCFLSANRKAAGIQTTAVCVYDDKKVSVYCKNRSLADILRSIAHEMFHLKQHEMNLVHHKMPPHHLNPIEWDANIAAGSLLSFFAQKVGRDKIYESKNRDNIIL
jgi:Zn-dependent peptidase ImmA (M78 family)